MKRSVIFILTTAVALALPAVAGAKEISTVELCGEESCLTITGAAKLRGLLTHGDSTSTSAAPPGPYYKVTMTAKHEEGTETWSIFYVPNGDRLAHAEGQWEHLTASAATAYARATAGLEPYPAPTLERVLIDGRAVEDAASYLALFSVGSTKDAVPSHLADWVLIDMRFHGETPWSGHPVFFSPSDGLLQRGIEIVRIPDELAASIRAGESLAAADGFPWAIAAVIALVLALVAGIVVWLAMRRESLLGTGRAPIPAP